LYQLGGGGARDKETIRTASASIPSMRLQRWHQGRWL